MADQPFARAIAVGIQSGFGVPDETLGALSGSIDETDGIIKGDSGSGDDETGFTAPTIYVDGSCAIS